MTPKTAVIKEVRKLQTLLITLFLNFLRHKLVLLGARLTESLFKTLMEEVVVANVASKTSKCLLTRCFAFCRSKCVEGDDERDWEYYVENRSVQYNLVCCSNGDRDQDKSFQYIPAYRESGNNYHRSVKNGLEKD